MRIALGAERFVKRFAGDASAARNFRHAAGAGNDTYFVDSVLDTVVETDAVALTGGIDKVVSSLTSWTLSANVENLTLAEGTATEANGNALANVLIGNSNFNVLNGYGGNDTLDGGGGIDMMSGGFGNDTCYVDNAQDIVIEDEVNPLTGGIDRVISSVSWTLGANVERLSLAENGAIDGTGNTLANVLNGNSSANVLSGLAGNDVLRGFAGDDTLIGGLGKDTLVGGTGADTF